MKIKRMTANFGRLEHETLELHEGMNLLVLPNEGGKSTWSAFIRVMFYGLNTRERDKKGFLADKTRFQPWNGGAMEGEMVVEWQGKDLRIRRYTKGSAPMGVCEITYADTDEPVSGLNGNNLGDVLLGVSRSVYERSAFLSADSSAVSQTPELEKRLAALVSSGEEGVSATQVREKLSDWQRIRQYRTKGYIPTLEARKEQLEANLEGISDLTVRIRDTKTKLDQYDDVRSKLRYQLALCQAQTDHVQATAYQNAADELKRAKEQLEKLEQQLPASGQLPEKAKLEKARDDVAALRGLDASIKQAQQQVPPAEEAALEAEAACADPVFTGTIEETRAQVKATAEQAQQLEEQAKKKNRMVTGFPIAGALLTAVLLVVMHIAFGELKPIVFAAFGCLAVGILCGVVFGVQRKALLRQSKDVLRRFDAETVSQLQERAEHYCRRREHAQHLEQERQRLQTAADELKAKRELEWQNLRDFVVGFAPEVKDVFGFSAAVTRALTLINGIDEAKRRVETAEKLFEVVSANGKGVAAAPPEEPSLTKEKAEPALREADRRITVLQSDLAMLQGRMSAQGEEETILAELERIEQDLKKYRQDYDALQIALDVLNQADEEMRSRFSPELNRKASAYLARLTDNRYDKVCLTREMDAGAEETDGVVTRDVLSLSTGTAEQLWLAVRLAVCDLALPEENPCPLVLDDALSSFDDDRVLLALRLLKEISRRRQIILFSCHSKESELYYTRVSVGG